MTPGDHARESKLIRILKEVEVKINLLANFMTTAGSAYGIEARPLRWSDWKIVLKTAEFKREDSREFVCEVATSSDIHVAGNWRARDTR